jgi:hypothetical protein
MGFVTAILMIIGWLLIIFGAFGSGLSLNVGNLSGVDVGFLFVLAALCIGIGPGVVASFRSSP